MNKETLGLPLCRPVTLQKDVFRSSAKEEIAFEFGGASLTFILFYTLRNEVGLSPVQGNFLFNEMAERCPSEL